MTALTKPSATAHFTVAIDGFGSFERSTLASFFRLVAGQVGAYSHVDDIELADLIIADAAVPAVVARTARSGRLADTVFIGGEPPAGALGWLPRPIAPSRIVRELDALAAPRRAALGPEPMPAHPVEAIVAGGPAHAAAGGGPVRPHHGRDVLVVEDSGIARKFLALRLQRMGYAVHVARSGEQAIEMLGERSYTIVFADVQLGPPGSLDGLSLCRHIKQRGASPGASVPAVIVVTGLAGAMDQVRGSLAGCDAWLTKPLVEADFQAALRRLDPAFAVVAG